MLDIYCVFTCSSEKVAANGLNYSSAGFEKEY